VPSRTPKVAIPAVHDLLAKSDQELRQQHSRFEKLSSEFESLKNSYIQLSNVNDDLQQSLQHVSTRYSHIALKYIQPYADRNRTQYNDRDEHSIKQVMRPMLQDALDAAPLREQVQNLQKEMLSKVEKIQAMSDDELAREFRALASAIKSLSRKMRLKGDIDVHDLLGTPLLLSGVSSEHWQGRARKSYMEAWMWATLLRRVFLQPFAVFGSKCEAILNIWQNMFDAPYCHDQSYPTSASEAWRFTTVERLIEMVGEQLVTDGTYDEMLQHTNSKAAQELSASVIQARTQTLDNLETGLGLASTSFDTMKVREIVDKAYTLALQMVRQRARVQITYPSIGVDFNMKEMSPIETADNEDIQDGVVLLIVNPGLTKWGDTHAKHLDQRYDIVSSLVQAKPARPVDGIPHS
jgi:hypothetical protein